MLKTPFYDPTRSYDENYVYGPFGAFVDGKVYKQRGEPEHIFLGHKVHLPFGIPAGPILNSAYANAAFDKGFDIVVYKTVRSDIYPCHPHPNVLAVELTGDLTIEKSQQPIIAHTRYKQPLSITNSFGVPSKPAHIWQADVRKAIKHARKGQILVLSFMGTVKPKQSEKQFVDDYALAAKQSVETGVLVLEVNLSCPNIGNEGLVCYNLPITQKILKAIRKVIGAIPLIVKTGYFTDDTKLKKFAEICDAYADAISAINTIPAPVVNKKGEPALPGPNRLKSGICGASIKWAGIDMVKRLARLRDKFKFHVKIEGVGGVMKPADYHELIAVGADGVMSATGAMWNPLLAQHIKKSLKARN